MVEGVVQGMETDNDIDDEGYAQSLNTSYVTRYGVLGLESGSLNYLFTA